MATTNQSITAGPSREPQTAATAGTGLSGGGLTSSEAAARLAEVGPNEPVRVRRLSSVLQLIRLFLNPLVIILLVASGMSALLGQVSDAVIIISMVLLGVGINFWQSYRSQQAAERLRAMVTPTATVCRDGQWQELPISGIVPGDLIRLSAGDLVPADARLIESHDLSVQQSMLTGESLPADKHAAQPTSDTGPGAPHLVFLGTSVVSGTATAVAISTGPRTLFGDIAARLSLRPPETEFEHGLRRFSILILTTTITLVLFIVLVSIAFKHNAFESLLFAVALGVGLTPEFLPMISSVTLTRGALRMAREHVIVKHLPAIQNFGSIDVLCSDKTGTLTAGVMQVAGGLDPSGAASPRPFQLAYLNSHFQTGIRSPFDTAILKHQQVDLANTVKLDEIPFDFERRRLSVVVSSLTAHSAAPLLITKGAPESVIAVSSAIEMGGRTTPLDEHARGIAAEVVARLSAAGFRVLAIAYRAMDTRPTYAKTDESDLVLAGFLSFADPILPDAAAALKDMANDGVTVKILTGDHEVVARHVCRQVGVSDEAIVTGDDLDRLDDAALGHVAEQANVFTRVSPAQKNRIILALKRRGHVVGFLGDGINDAPSLHAADVGISVMNAADVARQAADIILVEPGLRVLHRGILEGRRASGNMMKYLLMGTSSNFGNMFSMAAASLFLPFLPMLPTQILLNNFLYDLAQITIPSDNVDPNYIQRPQRWDMRVIRDFMIFIGPISSIFDFLTFYAMLRIFHASQELFHTGWFVESLATQTLVLFVIRTTGNPFRSRPSRPLAITTIAIVAIGAILPATPLASLLGFTMPPARYFVLLLVAVVVYLALVEIAKRQLVRRLHL
ncbi:MAG TPA: magnesium-translocating P-type ATPase [Vicinamibacterales bacterium]|nr:magnesium-translocating P-type ATPase [Vicinamibacterales bacterium]